MLITNTYGTINHAAPYNHDATFAALGLKLDPYTKKLARDGLSKLIE